MKKTMNKFLALAVVSFALVATSCSDDEGPGTENGGFVVDRNDLRG